MLWFGEYADRPVKTNHETDFIMDSAFSYYTEDDPQLPYVAGELFLDNGAFSVNMKNIELNTDRVVFIQEKLDPSLTIPLDYPFKTGMSTSIMQKRWRKTSKNIKYWQTSTSLDGRLVPALHAWSKESLKKNLRWLQKHANADYMAVGSIVSSEFSSYCGFFGDRQPNKTLIDMISLTLEQVRKFTDFKVHFMGFGSSPLSLHMGYYLGIDSTDTSGYRRKAAYGNILLPGCGERYVGNQSANFGSRCFSERDRELLMACDCEVCKTNQDQLYGDWKSRTLHNEHVMKKEKEHAEFMMQKGLDAYEAYLDSIFSRSGLKFLWEYTKLRRKYTRISDVLFMAGKR
jgi:7-cyano-7-deazaguanine tRNA-ribosyltransferase